MGRGQGRDARMVGAATAAVERAESPRPGLARGLAEEGRIFISPKRTSGKYGANARASGQAPQIPLPSAEEIRASRPAPGTHPGILCRVWC